MLDTDARFKEIQARVQRLIDQANRARYQAMRTEAHARALHRVADAAMAQAKEDAR